MNPLFDNNFIHWRASKMVKMTILSKFQNIIAHKDSKEELKVMI